MKTKNVSFTHAIKLMQAGHYVRRHCWMSESFWYIHNDIIKCSYKLNNHHPIISTEDLEGKDWRICKREELGQKIIITEWGI